MLSAEVSTYFFIDSLKGKGCVGRIFLDVDIGEGGAQVSAIECEENLFPRHNQAAAYYVTLLEFGSVLLPILLVVIDLALSFVPVAFLCRTQLLVQR